MYKTVLILFLVCFACYLPFSRRPDFVDGKYTDGVVVDSLDVKTNQHFPRVKYVYSLHQYQTFDPAYVLNKYTTGQKVKVIYEDAHPEKASVYRMWGYWVRWKEILACVVIYILLLQLSIAITSNPSQERLDDIEREEKEPKIRKPRYDGNTF